MSAIDVEKPGVTKKTKYAYKYIQFISNILKK